MGANNIYVCFVYYSHTLSKVLKNWCKYVAYTNFAIGNQEGL